MHVNLLTVLLVLTAGGASAQVDSTVERVAETQAHLPWFWSRPMEGFFEIPYTFESEGLHQVLDSHGREKKHGLRLHLERTAVLGGIFNRCVAENGVSPCSGAMLAVYQAGNQKVVFGDEQKNALREHRLQFWSEFPKAFEFTRLSGDRFRFLPRRDYHNTGVGAHMQLLAGIQGEITIDPRTYEITAMSWEILKDLDIPGRRLAKGTKYAVTLMNDVNGRYLPSRLSFEQPFGKDRVVQVEDYSNFKKFAVDVDVQFGDATTPQ